MHRSSWSSRIGLSLLVVAAVLAAVGAWMIYVPAGVLVAAAASFSAGYALLYVEARNASDRQSAASR